MPTPTPATPRSPAAPCRPQRHRTDQDCPKCQNPVCIASDAYIGTLSGGQHAEDLVLQTAERAAREDEIIDVSARLPAGLVHDADGASALRRVLPQALPWMTFLPAKAVDDLVEELVTTLQAAVSIDNLWPVSQLLVEWRHTAEIYADPLLYTAATRALGAGRSSRTTPQSGRL